MPMMTELKGNIGTRIRNLRKSKGIQGKDFAEEAFISATYLSDIENGRTLPALDTLFDICNALDVPLSDFFGGVSELPANIIRLIKNVQKLEESEVEDLSNLIESIVKRTEGS